MTKTPLDFPNTEQLPLAETKASVNFGVYSLDTKNEQLCRETQAIRLSGKAFAVLRYLVAHPNQLVSKRDLFKAVWPETIVSQATLTSCIKELRKALQDNAKAPQYIETVHRRGYRFIEKVVSDQSSVVSPPPAPPLRSQLVTSDRQPTTCFVGRDHELTKLHCWFDTALGGKRQVVFVTGEAGIGKTTLIERFLNSRTLIAQTQDSSLWISHGQCVEQYGAGEPYMPVFEALGRLCRTSTGGELISLLRRHAPTWLAHMPALLSDDEREALQRQVGGATRDRMLRELAEALEAMTVERPLLLWIEDLHWSDYSTLELLSVLARRREPARLLVIGTYRPIEALSRAHPLRRVTQELQLSGQCHELAVPFFSQAAVGQYLSQRFVGRAIPAGVERLLHRHTEGNPLFLVTMTDYWVRQRMLEESDGTPSLRLLEKTAIGVPENLRQVIERHIEQLSPEEQTVLAVASVAGAEFSAAAVAAGLAIGTEAAEEACANLARQGQFLATAGATEWPDGTVAARYRFIHVLYQNVLYDRIPPAQRASVHLRIAERQERAYQHHFNEIAAELAVHFEEGRDFQRAVRYLGQAAQSALWTYAYHEACEHLTKSLALLARFPESPERTHQELSLQIGLSLSLMHTRGFAAPEVKQAYDKTRALCRIVGNSPQCFTALWGLRNFYLLGGEIEAGHAMAQEFLELVQRSEMSSLATEAHLGLGTPLFHLGQFDRARTHLEQSIVFYRPDLPQQQVFLTGQDPRASSLAHLALVLWLLGYPDQARERSRQALELAHDTRFPYGRALALNLDATLQLCYRNLQGVTQQAEAARSFAHECGFVHLMVMGMMLQGWALVMQGQEEEGIALMLTGLERQHALGIGIGEVSYQLLLADAYIKVGQIDTGKQVLAEAFSAVEKTKERTFAAELYRLKGTLTLQSQASLGQVSDKSQARSKLVKASQNRIETLSTQHLTPSTQAEIEGYFLKAIEIAQQQHAKSLELRAVTALCRLWQHQGRTHEARDRLSGIYDWFTEGFDTADLLDARALLAELT
jgi:DNA-binding winged helix-turn-helix (wHTH) protein/tetratricopeptide (TPR) repeat protein